MVWQFPAMAGSGKHVLPMVWMMVLTSQGNFFAADTIKPDLQQGWYG
jgi:hypothetical protein